MSSPDLHIQAEDLLRAQLAEWPMAGSNYAALEGVRVREIDIDGITMKVQFNPARIVSSGAKVDAASLKARPCFLCGSNRPAQQRGLPWGDYTVLINPFPIFPRHFTIPLNAHTEQRIAGRIGHMMSMAIALDGYTVFYNGPRCGASAPDHMHFQAGNTDFLTLPQAIGRSRLSESVCVGSARLSTVAGMPMGVLVIDAETVADGESLFAALYDSLPLPADGEEPMMNLLCYACGSGVRLIVIPRLRHRPSCYGSDGMDTMLISPASVDLGGVFITPLEKDFETLTADRIKEILAEVCMTPGQVSAVADTVRNNIER
ncbi:MAG: DUF4922 domain-containing protein [Muribaculaceae bacterium]|nr:DUF4922 domain-containing protein [Muribaculaceae bacterium]